MAGMPILIMDRVFSVMIIWRRLIPGDPNIGLQQTIL